MKKRISLLLLLVLMLITLSACNTNNIALDKNVYLLYKCEETNDNTIKDFEGKDTIELIALLKINESEEGDLYGITGDNSKEYAGKLYYDVFKVKNEENEIFIYYHIKIDSEIDINNLTLCKENKETKAITKYAIPNEVHNDIFDFKLDYIDINGNAIIYMNKSMEKILKYKEKEEREVWFHFIPLNCKYSDIDINVFAMELQDIPNECKIDSVLSPNEYTTNTGKSNIAYSPLNIVIKGIITVENGNTLPEDILKKTILKVNSTTI